MENKVKSSVSSVTSKILVKLNALTDSSSGKAILAKLRNSVGKPLSETAEIWQLLFDNLPEEFLGKTGEASMEERAILTTLQLYAIHQQGAHKSVLLEGEDRFKNIGYSLKNLQKDGRQSSIDRRFNTMITATNFEELTYHLRHLIKLLKSKSSETKVDYAKLAEDLYWFLRGYEENIRLAWAREYYKQNFKGDEDNEK